MEIKLRGKSVASDLWVFGNGIKKVADKTYIQTDDGKGPIDIWQQVIPETVGRHLGRKDIEDKDIYAGDYLKDEEDTALIFYSEEACSFIARNQYGDEFYLSEFKSPRVIGNIHDNPELLEGK